MTRQVFVPLTKKELLQIGIWFEHGGTIAGEDNALAAKIQKYETHFDWLAGAP